MRGVTLEIVVIGALCCPSSTARQRRSSLERQSHTRTAQSSPPDHNSPLRRCISMARTEPWCPRNVATHATFVSICSGAFGSHTLMVASSLPERTNSSTGSPPPAALLSSSSSSSRVSSEMERLPPPLPLEATRTQRTALR
ncbi:hypothetical protein DQ04_13131000 [Trypanosoma grayi]|uniref:hypothetical protein n=1 Tax=Trypanosoma grayi TaxID=71804 RepID=UPI0004F4307F|nr:hypothetical protein DQ04_13131000 [Trypanosoma grayi]KEG06598.1 hypothetical protein DQ04_13131000 [Trypanosoma grayi]